MNNLLNFMKIPYNLYSKLNGTNITGAVDVLVIKQPNGDYKCSPFYVSFGKLSVLFPQDNPVKISINGKLFPELTMQVNSDGYAYFLFPNLAIASKSSQTEGTTDLMHNLNRENQRVHQENEQTQFKLINLEPNFVPTEESMMPCSIDMLNKDQNQPCLTDTNQTDTNKQVISAVDPSSSDELTVLVKEEQITGSKDAENSSIRRCSNYSVDMNKEKSTFCSEINLKEPCSDDALGPQFYRTQILTSDQLKNLGLNYGPNDVIYEISTQYHGTTQCRCRIYLWNYNDRIIISDIDGTITKSDLLGHILPLIGIDWTHPHIVRTYDKIAKNNYRFVYLSSRSMSLARMTHALLKSVKHGDYKLPDGPVFLYPRSICYALYVEIIKKRADIYKSQCLQTICSLFNYENPVVSAFGNRATDVRAYQETGLKDFQLFTVFYNGDVIQGCPDNYYDPTKTLINFPQFDSTSQAEVGELQRIFCRKNLFDFADVLWPVYRQTK